MPEPPIFPCSFPGNILGPSAVKLRLEQIGDRRMDPGNFDTLRQRGARPHGAWLGVLTRGAITNNPLNSQVREPGYPNRLSKFFTVDGWHLLPSLMPNKVSMPHS